MSAIFLIEDDAIVQHVHVLMFRKLGYQMDLAETGATALEMFKKENSYQIIFVDIGLPDMNGAELIKVIRSQDEAIPIIALTGYIGDHEKSLCLAAGATEVIHKPILMNKMLTTLKKYLRSESTSL